MAVAQWVPGTAAVVLARCRCGASAIHRRRNHADLLAVQKVHAARPARVDAARLAVVSPDRGTATVQAQVDQLSADSAHRDRDTLGYQLQATRRALVLALTAWPLDPGLGGRAVRPRLRGDGCFTDFDTHCSELHVAAAAWASGVLAALQ